MSAKVCVTLIGHDGTEYPLDVEPDQTIMEAAVIQGVPGILAECGGAPQCSSCSVAVPEEWRSVVGEPEELEVGVLQFNNKLGGSCRLTCQMIPEADWDGLVLHVPESQY